MDRYYPEASQSTQEQHPSDINHLLVCGYIRRISLAVSTVTRIPIDIVRICCLFYNALFKIFIYSILQRKIAVFHIKKNRISKIILSNRISKHSFSKPMCYINNISLEMNIERNNRLDLDAKKSYDAILSVESNHDYYYPNILLFKSSKIENKIINYISFKSNTSLPVDSNTIGYKYGAHHPIYCGRNNGIIYEFDGDLYRLKLSDINIESRNYTFTKIKAKQTHFWDHINYHAHPKYLSIMYLKQSNTILSVRCDWKKRNWVKSNVKCAIFDLIQYEWRSIADIKYEELHQGFGYYAHQICYNPFDSHCVYAVSNTGNTLRYVFRKNEWYILADNCLSLKPYNHIVWMDNPNILCCTDGIYFGYFDCRNKHWNKLNRINELMDVMNSNDLYAFV